VSGTAAFDQGSACDIAVAAKVWAVDDATVAAAAQSLACGMHQDGLAAALKTHKKLLFIARKKEGHGR
jgi:hypothetical protein